MVQPSSPQARFSTTRSSPTRAGAAAGFATLHGLFWLTVNLAERGPLALAVDDLHWCDDASLGALAYVLRRIEGLPVLLVVSLRPGEPGAEAARLSRLVSDPRADAVRPAPLTPRAVALLVGETLSPHADEEFCVACHSATEGNPLLLHELLRALRAEGVSPTGEAIGRVHEIGPQAVSRAVLLRLGQLPADATTLARAVALLGDGVELRHGAAVVELEREQAATAAELLSRVGILEPKSRLAFVHPVVRTAVYQEIPPSEREHLHAKAARILADGGAPSEQVAAQLLAAPPSGWLFAVAALREAARRSLARGAPKSAVAYLRRALEEPPAQDERADVLYELGSAERLIYGPTAVEHLTEALSLMEDPQRRAETALDLGRTLFFSQRQHEAIAVFENAPSALSDGGELRQRLEAGLLHGVIEEPSLYPLAVERIERLSERPPAESPGERALLAILAYHDARAGRSLVEAVARAGRRDRR